MAIPMARWSRSMLGRGPSPSAPFISRASAAYLDELNGWLAEALLSEVPHEDARGQWLAGWEPATTREDPAL
eukprot:14978709-Heterocapsa_arctica.AAC.1